LVRLYADVLLDGALVAYRVLGNSLDRGRLETDPAFSRMKKKPKKATKERLAKMVVRIVPLAEFPPVNLKAR
jgi:hypothetical protein